MITFNYKNNKYEIFFYPCGNMARLRNIKNGKIKEVKFDKTTTVKDLLSVIDRLEELKQL